MLFLMGTIPSALLYAQNNFARGMFLFGGTYVDYVQMRDSLYLNWVQAEIEDTSGNKFSNVLSNGTSLNIMGQANKIIARKSSAQCMKFAAVQVINNLNIDYFATRSRGKQDINNSNLWEAIPSTTDTLGFPGYMVKSPVPNNEYHYNQKHYIASFQLKRTPAASNYIPVVRLEAWWGADSTKPLDSLTLYNKDFTSTNLETKTLTFDLPTSYPMASIVPGVLNRGVTQTSKAISSLASYTSTDSTIIDIRVYWYGNVTTWLDSVIIQDTAGQNVFSGLRDAAITNSASGFTGYSNLKRFYLTDEPYISAFLAYNYVQNKVRGAYGTDTVNGKASGITVAPHDFSRFMNDAQPHEMFIDWYPINADVPCQSMTTAEASSVGIATSATDTTFLLQAEIDSLVTRLNTAAVVAKQAGRSFWFCPQLHGSYCVVTGTFRDNNGWYQLRPPTGTEIQMMCNLGVAYGAKGIVPYPYNNSVDDASQRYYAGLTLYDAASGLYKNHWTNYATYPVGSMNSTVTKSIRMGFKEKWDSLASVMKYYAHVDSTTSAFSLLTWQGAKNWKNSITAGTWSGLVSSVTSATTGVYPVTDAVTYVETGVFSYNGLDYIFVVNRRTLSADRRNITVTINESSIYNNWKVTEVGTNNTWTASKTGQFKTTFQPGEGKLFRLEPVMLAGGTIAYTETVPANSTLSVAGNIVILSGVTLNLQSGTTLNIASGDSITCNGILTATGSSSSPVTFNFSGTGGIVISGSTSSSSNLNYVTINSGAGVSFTNGSTATIQSSSINNCTQGVYIYNSSPTVASNSILNSTNYGVYIDGSSSSPIIDSNLVKKTTGLSGTGIYATNNATPTICSNKVSGFNYGIYIGGGSFARFHIPSNSYRNNLIYGNFNGLTAAFSATVYGAYYIGANNVTSYNSIHGNSGCDAYSYHGGHLYAQIDYWGSSPRRVVSDTATIDTTGPLSYDPWSGITPGIKQKNNSKSFNNILASVTTSSVTDTSMMAFNSGLNFEDNNNITGAISQFISMIVKDSHAELAITELFKLMKQYTRSDILTYFGNISSGSKHYPLVSKLIADNNLQSGQFSNAISAYDKLIQNYPNDYYGINARFQKLFAYLNINNDKTTAQQILSEIKDLNLSTTDPQWTSQIQMAENLLGTSGITMDKSQAIEVSKNVESENNPKEYALFNNYPNPFNPTTIIEYQLPKDGFVSLKVYDILGREIKTLVNGFRTLGKYSVSFDGTNLASGIYFYQLKSNGFSSIKKMILTK
jgi:hypothetical protein